MRHASYTDTRATLAAADQRLGVACVVCPNAVALRADEIASPDDGRPLWQLNFRCRCGDRLVEKFVIEAGEVEAFLAGERPRREGAHIEAARPYK